MAAHGYQHSNSPIRVLLLGFVALAIIGTVLLVSPIATTGANRVSALDGLFTAVSAISTTGLTVVSIGGQFSRFGQIVLLALMQIGGIGYMTLVAFLMTALGAGISQQGGRMMEASLPVPSRGEIREFVTRAVWFTVLFEVVGAVALGVFWAREYPIGEAVYLGIFHAISAFCTAGFALFDDGFVAYRDDAAFNVIINVLAVAGAIGFMTLGEAQEVLMAVVRRQPRRRVSVHTRLALTMSAVLLVFGATALLVPSPTMGGSPTDNNALAASFQAVQAVTTTGFNTVDIGALSTAEKSVMAALMFVGAPAGGTGGGIKSTTLGVLLLLTWAVLRGHRDINAFGRRLETATLGESIGILMTALLWLIPVVVILTVTERALFLDVVFEAVSALGTVGLSTGLTPDLSAAGKVVLIATMFVGRLGPLTIALSVTGARRLRAYRYPTEQVFVG